jgi:hypothetical protein
MEYRCSPTRRIESRRNREMDEKQVHTMAAAKNIVPGSDWHIALWTTDAKVRVQKNGSMHAVSDGA